jgi:hypothetical protein
MLQEAIAEGLFDDSNELFAVEEGGAGSLNHSQNELEAEDFRPHSEGIHHTILSAKAATSEAGSTTGIGNILQTQLADALEDNQGIGEIPTCLICVVKVRGALNLWRFDLLKYINMLLLALERANWMSGILAIQVRLTTAIYTPTEFASQHPYLIFYLNLNMFFLLRFLGSSLLGLDLDL